MIKKTVKVKTKASLKSSSRIRKINSKCLKSYKQLVKKDKDADDWKNWDGDKAKLYNPFCINTDQLQTQVSKKDKCHESRQRNHLTTEVNATKITNEDKDKAEDLSYIKCYICIQKDHYTNKCPKKSKNW